MLSRFKAIMSFNDKIISFAIGENKQKSKLNACRHALAGIVPQLYTDWKKEYQGGGPVIPDVCMVDTEQKKV